MMKWMPELTRIALLFTIAGATACGAADGSNNEHSPGVDGPNNECCYDEPGINNGSYDEAAGDATAGGNDGVEIEEPVEVDPGQLTAGRHSDLDDWSFWLKLMDPNEERGFRDMTTAWGLHPFERVDVVISDGAEPARDVAVELHDGEAQLLWESRTDATGTAVLFPNMLGGDLPESLVVSAGESSTTLEPGQELVELEVDAEAPADVLDVLFTIDVTGSMTDEQNYLRAEMADVMERLATQRPALEIRTSFNFYCDPEDSFLVESHPFSDVPTALDVLNDGAGCGGGDFPEAVDEGLEDALAHDWSDSARARILFLVLDAPPHSDAEGLDRLHRFAERASANGIKLVPIVSSGSDHSLEFLMRSLVIATNGTYTFLTAHSGIGGEKLEPTIPQYEVELLNELMLDLLLTESAAP